MNVSDKIFIVSISCCGDVKTKYYTSKSIFDVYRLFLIKRYSPNPFYYCQAKEIEYSNEVPIKELLIFEAMRCQPDIDIDIDLLKGLSKKEVIMNFENHTVKSLFDYAFTGGEGDQSGNPGKEWTTITVTDSADLKTNNVDDELACL